MRRLKLTIILICLSLAANLAIISACSPPAGKPPGTLPASAPGVPQFRIEVLTVTPGSVMLNQPVTVTAIVRNTGSASGIYTGNLLINGRQADSRTINVSAGSSRLLEFTPAMSSVGDTDIAVGEKHATVRVQQVLTTRTLQIDNGIVDGFDPIIGSTGSPYAVMGTLDCHMVRFTSPPEGFEITGASIYGYLKDSDYDYDHDPAFGGPGLWVYGTGIAILETVNKNFNVNIYDAKGRLLFSREYPKEKFLPFPAWVNIDIPSIPVSGEFFIELQTNNPPRLFSWGAFDRDCWNRIVKHSWYYQVWVGYENAVDVRSSVSQKGIILPERWLTYNWLMRVQGL
jgi:hypothetical protein